MRRSALPASGKFDRTSERPEHSYPGDSTLTSPKLRKVLNSQFLANFPEYRLKGRLLYKDPAQWILQGIYFDSSAFDKDKFAVHAFVQPLYVPAESIVLTLGRRLFGPTGEWWNLADGLDLVRTELHRVVETEALPLLARGSSPEGIVTNLSMFLSNPESERALEVSAYSKFMYGDKFGGISDLHTLVANTEQFDSGSGWIHDLRNRAQNIARKSEADFTSVLLIFAKWRTDMVEKIRNIQRSAKLIEPPGHRIMLPIAVHGGGNIAEQSALFLWVFS